MFTYEAVSALVAQLLVTLYTEPVINDAPLVPDVPETAELAATQLPVTLK